MEAQARFDVIKELITTVETYRAAHPGATIMSVTLTDVSLGIGMGETSGNVTIATQFSIAL